MRSWHFLVAPFALAPLGLAASFAVIPAPARAVATLPADFSDELIVAGLNFPVFMAFLPDGRLLVSERNDARIRLVIGTTLVPAPVIALDSVRVGSESGLLGIAVDPGWPARPYVYAQYNWTGGPWMRLVRYTLTGDLDNTGSGALAADPASRFIIFNDLPDNSVYHNGGSLRFGPDGMLYEVLGEDLDQCSAPLVQVLKGKLLRLDLSRLPAGPGWLSDLALVTPPDNPFVAHPDPRAHLVWEYGLRNPWGFHFDPPTGRIFLGDVGGNSFEEVDLANAPGINFGWPFYEGYANTGLMCPGTDSTGSRAPIYAYDRRGFPNGAVIIGGVLYRRPASGSGRFPPEYDGDYFFSDAGEGFLRRLHETSGAWALADSVPGQPNARDWATGMDAVVDYEERPDGSLWYVKYFATMTQNAGQIRRIAYTGTLAVDPAGAGPLRFERPYPLPSRGLVALPFTLRRAGPIRLTVHDIAGRRVRVLIGGEPYPAGRQRAEWDGRDDAGRAAPAGLYLVRLVAPDGHAEGRCVIAR